MISVFIDAALRSLLVALVVAVGLGILRVRNVLAQKAAWGLVLVSALAMPLLLPVTAEWHLLPAGVNIVLPAHPMTLLEELQALIQARSGSASTVASETAPSSPSDPPRIEEAPTSEQAAAPHADGTPSPTAHTHRTAKPQQSVPFLPDSSRSSSAQPTAYNASPGKEMQSPLAVRHLTSSPILLALMLYCGIATIFFVRLALGLFITIRLWRSATPVPAHQLRYDAASLQVRASSKVASPLTIGSAILLPVDFTTWDSEKLRIVLAHERSHIRQGDFYLQLLAGLYAALFWFSPLGWWL
jgi:beta-lactamase regulating signal transducer with metallopeptidase domain